jgi:hypothetical protein
MTPRSYGLMAVFDTPEALVYAARRLKEAGYRRVEAYTPFPVRGLDDALELPPNRVPLVMLLGGLAGGLGAFGLQAWTAMAYWPLDVGGRPNFSWPAFVPITFELTILGAALAGFFGNLWLSGLPQPYHPAFNAPHFELASRNRFFLCVRAHDPYYDAEGTRRILESLEAREVDDVAY